MIYCDDCNNSIVSRLYPPLATKLILLRCIFWWGIHRLTKLKFTSILWWFIFNLLKIFVEIFQTKTVIKIYANFLFFADFWDPEYCVLQKEEKRNQGTWMTQPCMIKNNFFPNAQLLEWNQRTKIHKSFYERIVFNKL